MNKIKFNPAIVSVHDQSFVTNDEDGEWINLTDWAETEFISTEAFANLQAWKIALLP